MDIETSEAIETLRSDVRGVETALRAEIRAFRVEIRSEFREGLAESRRHSDILTESLRDDIRIVAEGLVALMAKVDAIRDRGGPA